MRSRKYDFIIFGNGYATISDPDRALLIGKPFSEIKSSLFPWRAAGQYKIASSLREKGFRVKVIDFLFSFSETELDTIIDKFVSDETLAIGFSLMMGNLSIDSFQTEFLNRVERIKNRAKLPIVFGGRDGHNFIDQVRYKALPNVIMYGESEFAISKYLSDLRNGVEDLNIKMNKIFDATKIMTNPIEETKNLTTFLHEDDDFFHGDGLTIEMSRGCIFNCSFCSYPLRGKSSSEHVVEPSRLREMMLHNYKLFGVKNYNIADSTFNDSIAKVDAIAEMIKTLPFTPEFFGYFRPDLLLRYKDRLPLLRDMGFKTMFLGIESLHPPTLKAIKKNLTFAGLKELLLAIHETDPNICVSLSMISGLPYETAEDFRANMDRIASLAKYFNTFTMSHLVLEIDSEYTSEFAKNSHMYGYEKFYDKDVNKNSWVCANNNMDSGIARELAKEAKVKIELALKKHQKEHFIIPHPHFSVFDTFIKTNKAGITMNNYFEKYKSLVLHR